MGDWKAQAPVALAVPSYVDANEQEGRSSFSAGGVQPFPIFNPDRLLSPHDPGFLDGASSLARFGLDIGGTLCKVVYFEPAMNFTKETSPRTWKQSKSAGFTEGPENGKLGKDAIDVSGDSQQPGRGSSADLLKKIPNKDRNGYMGNGIDRDASIVRVNDGNAEELMTAGVDQVKITKNKVTATSPKVHTAASLSGHVDSGGQRVENHPKDKSANGKTLVAVSDTFQRSGGDEPAVQACDGYQNDRRTGGGAVNGEDDQDSHQQRVKEIWVSSHEPVHLPGRGTLYFKCFETWQMEEFLNLTKEYHLMTGGRAIGATGGGARKFKDRFLDIAGLQLQRADELKSLVRGIDFLARHAQQESFEYPTGSYQGGSIQRPWQSPENSSDESSDTSSEEEFALPACRKESGAEVSSPAEDVATVEVAPAEKLQNAQKANAPTLRGPVLARIDSGFWRCSSQPLHPYLVVNIGSGVSMLRVDSPDKFERVGGTSLGGSTFFGLANALTGCQSFEEAISLATQGDSTHVDMLVGDIYGGDYTEMGLAATTVASSFGKLVLPQRSPESQDPQHLAKAALLMVTNNIGSIAMLHARNAGVSSIMFTGSFLHNNKLAMRLLAVAMEFWSKGKMKAVFLRHEGHAGAMGALLSALESSNPLDALLLT